MAAGLFVEEGAESVATFAHLYADRPLALMLLCEFILNSSHQSTQRLDSEMLLYHTLADLYLAKELKAHSLPPLSSSRVTGRKRGGFLGPTQREGEREPFDRRRGQKSHFGRFGFA